ncbi:IclR family transcriptional regulator [Saliniramus sp.]|uniref:IclR family transcriptional regulator n=1 Tax=Saliniramus sp. TaxID=2986772 RepID=UPI002C154868|nr:IclR family transcriptional regulator [Saliniramus sp.]HMB09176.1 IclR family transcriptional regulator [Saliniramus sp.]
MAEAQVSSVKTIGRAALVLRALAAGRADGSRLTDIAAATGLGKATVHRLLGALADVGFVSFDDQDKRYRLGYALFALGASARAFHVVDLARPGLMRLAAGTGDTVYLSVRDGDEAICVDRCTGSFPIRTLTLDVGDRRPLGIGAGALALLAFESEAEIARVIRTNADARRDYAAFDDSRLHTLITQARTQGYAFNDGNIVSAMSAIGVPVIDEAGRVLAALSIAAIRERFADRRLTELVALLQEEARELATALAHAALGPDEPGARTRRTRIREDVA